MEEEKEVQEERQVDSGFSEDMKREYERNKAKAFISTWLMAIVTLFMVVACVICIIRQEWWCLALNAAWTFVAYRWWKWLNTLDGLLGIMVKMIGKSLNLQQQLNNVAKQNDLRKEIIDHYKRIDQINADAMSKMAQEIKELKGGGYDGKNQ